MMRVDHDVEWVGPVDLTCIMEKYGIVADRQFIGSFILVVAEYQSIFKHTICMLHLLLETYILTKQRGLTSMAP